MAWDTSNLLSRIRRRLRIPDGSSAMSDAELLQLADEVTRIDLMALMRLSNGEWYVTKYTTPIVANQAEYRIPERVQAGSVRDVTLVDSGNTETDLPELLLEQARTWGSASSARVRGHLIEDNKVVLVPTPTTAGLNLCIRYRRQPSELVLPTDSNVQAITAVTSTKVTVTTLQSALYNASTADVVQASPPFDLLGGPGTAGNGDFSVNEWTPTDAQVAVDAQVGDYLCIEGFTPIPQMPPVFHDLLVWGVCKEAAIELGRGPMAREYESKYLRATEKVFDQINDRNEGADQKIVSPYSPLRQRTGWGWRAG